MTQNSIWNAVGYNRNSTSQSNAAYQLLKKVKFNVDDKILDIGCGDGKITFKLAQMVPKGYVLGIDKSEDMIKFSRSKFNHKDYPNLNFMLMDAQNIEIENQFNVIFSSFCIQWILDLEKFFTSIDRLIVKNGCFLATIPSGIPTALDLSLAEVTTSSFWGKYFKSFVKAWTFRNSAKFKQLLILHDYNILKASDVPQQEIFESRAQLENYFRFSFPYTHHLPNHLQDLFVKELIDRYLALEPPTIEDKINFKFERVDIIAQKN